MVSIIGMLASCSDDDTATEVIAQNVVISNTESYTYDLGGFGDEEGANIRTQAGHFEVSKLERDFNSGQVIYTYQPLAGYVGTDFVEITAGRGSDGASDNTEITLVKITFTITE